jgi:hypothetical protein
MGMESGKQGEIDRPAKPAMVEFDFPAEESSAWL